MREFRCAINCMRYQQAPDIAPIPGIPGQSRQAIIFRLAALFI
jgi:hypothetical protein